MNNALSQRTSNKASVTRLFLIVFLVAFFICLGMTSLFVLPSTEQTLRHLYNLNLTQNEAIQSQYLKQLSIKILGSLSLGLTVAFAIMGYVGRKILIKPYAELKDSEERLHAAQQAAEKIAQIPINNPSPTIQISVSGEVLFANPSARERYQDIEILGFRHPALAGLESYALEYSQRHMNTLTREWLYNETPYYQTIMPVVVEGKKTLVIYAYDITSIKKEQERSRLMQAAIENAKDAVLITDANLETGPHIIYVNEAFTRLTEYTLAEVVGKTPKILQGRDIDKKVTAQLGNNLREGKPFQGQLKNYTKSGKAYWLDISIMPVKNERGEITHFAAIERDITQQKAFEKELMITREAAEVASRAKGNFLANMSHELRTPMNGIIGLSGLLLDTPMSHEDKESLYSIHHSAEGLLALLNDLLDFSKIEAGELTLEMVPMNVPRSIMQVTNMLRPMAAKKMVSLSTTISPLVPTWVIGDHNRIRQIFYNLIGNAVKFTEKGSVHIDVSVIRENGEATVRFRIEDTGVGISPEFLDVIFEKFTQGDVSTARKFGGTGLGLTITKQLVEMMGGRIGVESVVGLGSTFWFDVPFESLENYQEDSAETTEGGSSEHYFRNHHALIVDDHPTNILFMRKLLMKLGFSVIHAANDGEEAISRYQNNTYSIILMDCQMPGVDGFLATRRIRELESATSRAHTPIIAVTADAMKGTQQKCLESGMDYYVTKPISIAQVRDAISLFIKTKNSDSHANPSDQWIQQVKAHTHTSLMDQAPVDLTHLRQFTDGNPEEEKEFFDIFLTQAEEGVTHLSRHITDEYNEEWKRTAHKLKGSAANLGANTLSNLCKEAENLADATAENKAVMHENILNELSKVQAFLGELHA